MINSKNKIHYIKNVKRLSNEIIRQLIDYHNPKMFLGWSKRKKKFVLKEYS